MRRFIGVLLFLIILVPVARAQGVQNQVLGLLPAQTGEVAFLDVKTLRGSPHYEQLKAQVLPERFRSLVQWTQYIGIEFEKDVNQLSWAFLPPDTQGNVGLIGIAEGTFDLAELEKEIKTRKLNLTRHRGHMILSLGKNDRGQDFVFAFVDGASAIFGFREPALEVLDRRAQGGQSLLNNRGLMDLVSQVNGRAPLWMALDRQFTLLAVKQMLPGAETLPGFENLAQKLESSVLRFELGTGMRGQAALRCSSGADATLISAGMQLALNYQAGKLKEQDADLARVLGSLNMSTENDSVRMALNISDTDFATLLSKNSLALKF